MGQVPRIALGVVALAGAIALVPTSAQAAATTLYVATNGNDGNAGTPTAPLATVQKAVSLVSAGGATQRIPDGALVEVDGTAGTVTVVG